MLYRPAPVDSNTVEKTVDSEEVLIGTQRPGPASDLTWVDARVVVLITPDDSKGGVACIDPVSFDGHAYVGYRKRTPAVLDRTPPGITSSRTRAWSASTTPIPMTSR